MVVAQWVDRLVESVDHLIAVARQKIADIQLSLLQIPMGIEGVGEPFDLRLGSFITTATVMDEPGSKVVQLIKDLLTSTLECLGEGRIDRLERFAKPFELFVDQQLRLVKDGRSMVVEASLDDLLQESLAPPRRDQRSGDSIWRVSLRASFR